MAKILVVYYSRSGNTKKMALAVAEGAEQVKGMNVTVKKAAQTSLEDLQQGKSKGYIETVRVDVPGAGLP